MNEIPMDEIMKAFDLEFDIDKLRQYYQWLFPSELMFKWLSYYKAKLNEENALECEYFFNREFSFTLEGDIYCRYLCFQNPEQFKETLTSRAPVKIDIGAVFNIPVRVTKLTSHL